MRMPNAIDLVSTRYEQKPKDVERWYHSTEWAIHGWVSEKMTDSIVFHLKTAGIIQNGDEQGKELIWKR